VRCAETVKRVLVEKFGLAAEALIAVGFGSSKPKNPADPASTENQRIEILKMEMGVARPAVSR
jgi:flagellar motor protein MotB